MGDLPCTTTNFPDNYDMLPDANMNLVYQRTLELNVMSQQFPDGCDTSWGPKVFTLGQGERMRCHIEADKLEYITNNPNEECPANLTCTVIGGDILADVTFSDPCYHIVGDLNIADGVHVTFLNTDVTIFNEFDNSGDPIVSFINVGHGSILTIQSSIVRYEDCFMWGGIRSQPDGIGCTVGIWNSKITNADKINMVGSTFNMRDSYLDRSPLFLHSCTVNFMADNAFDISPIDLKFTDTDFRGCKYLLSTIEATDSGVIIDHSPNHLPAFYNCGILYNSGPNLTVDNAYFNPLCFNPIVVRESDNVMICRCWFEECGNGSPLVQIQTTSRYYIFHNLFEDSAADKYIEIQTISSEKSLIQNNIFTDGNVHIDNSIDNFLDISCNFHEFASGNAWEIQFANMLQQGAFDQPAGNVFIGTSDDIANLGGSQFIYYVDPTDPNQIPQLSDVEDATILNAFGNQGICLSRNQIAGIWQDVVLCIPGNTGWYSSWPECGDTWCLQSPSGCGDPLPPPTPVNNETPSGQIIDPDFGSFETLEGQEFYPSERENIEEIKIWPNPTENILNIFLGKKTANIKIIDTNGKIITELSGTETIEINVSEYPSGLYNVIISNSSQEKAKFTKRIFIK